MGRKIEVFKRTWVIRKGANPLPDSVAALAVINQYGCGTAPSRRQFRICYKLFHGFRETQLYGSLPFR